MDRLEIAEVVKDLQTALSKALNGEVIREYEHLQVRAEEVVKNCNIPAVIEQSEQLKNQMSDFEMNHIKHTRSVNMKRG